MTSRLLNVKPVPHSSWVCNGHHGPRGTLRVAQIELLWYHSHTAKLSPQMCLFCSRRKAYPVDLFLQIGFVFALWKSFRLLLFSCSVILFLMEIHKFQFAKANSQSDQHRHVPGRAWHALKGCRPSVFMHVPCALWMVRQALPFGCGELWECKLWHKDTLAHTVFYAGVCFYKIDISQFLQI